MKKKQKNRVSIGFDLGGTKMMAVVYDGCFKELGRERRRTRGEQGPTAGMKRLKDAIMAALSSADMPLRRLKAIGIGIPGTLDLEKGVILDCPNLGWRNIPIRKILRKEFDCAVEVVNDVDAGLYGEYMFGAARKARTVVGVFPGTGVGGACIYDGRLVRGKDRSCMEIGHLPLVPDGVLCGCGRRGCLETVSSRLAIASQAAAAAHRGEAPHLLKLCGAGVSNARSRAIAESINAGDKAVETIMLDAARWLGKGIASAVNLLAPDVVVVGGGLVESFPGAYMKMIKTSTEEHVMPSFRGTYRIVPASLGDDAVALGASALAYAVSRGEPV